MYLAIRNATCVFLVLSASAMAQSNFTGFGDGFTWNAVTNWDNGIPVDVNANIGPGFDVMLSTNQSVNELDLVGDQSPIPGAATLTHGAGTLNNANWLKIGQNAGNTATYTMNGTAETNFGVLFMASGGGTGTLDLSGDAVISGGGVNAGFNADSTATINIADNAMMSVTDFNLGNGSVNQTGGMLVASSWIAVSKDGGIGTYDISGGTLSQLPEANDQISIGESDPGALLVSGNATIDANSNGIIVGRFDGGDGLLQITGSSAAVMTNDLKVGIDELGTDTTATGTLSWIADAGGITTIVSDDNTEFGMMDSTLSVDLSASDDFDSYVESGTMQEIVLIDNAAAVSGTFNGLPEGAEVSIGDMKTANVSYVGGADNFDIVLQVFVKGDILLGDVNCDGMTNLLDVAPFVDLVSNGEFLDKADINMDGIVNLLDVAPFVAILSGG